MIPQWITMYGEILINYYLSNFNYLKWQKQMTNHYPIYYIHWMEGCCTKYTQHFRFIDRIIIYLCCFISIHTQNTLIVFHCILSIITAFKKKTDLHSTVVFLCSTKQLTPLKIRKINLTEKKKHIILSKHKTCHFYPNQRKKKHTTFIWQILKAFLAVLFKLHPQHHIIIKLKIITRNFGNINPPQF